MPFVLALSCVLVAVSQGRRYGVDETGGKQPQDENISHGQVMLRLGPARRCQKGMHVKLDAEKQDRHIVNPRCGKQLGGRCTKDLDRHFILDDFMWPAAEFSEGRCSDLVRPKPWLDNPDDDFWEADSPATSGYLHGKLRFRCGRPRDEHEPNVKSTTWKGITLFVDDSDCRELLPFSTIFQHDTSNDSMVPVAWGTRPNHSHPHDLASHSCGPPPQESFLINSSSHTYSYDTAVGECAARSDCAAVAVNPRGGTELLREFTCRLGGKTSCSFDKGEKVRWHGTETPALEGIVSKSWNCEEDKEWVNVRFGDLNFGLPADGLERVTESKGAWSLTQIVRPKLTVKCGKLQEWHSCDIKRRSDAIILLRNQSKSELECRRACEVRTASANVLKSCCVLIGGVCALTTGEHFAMELDEDGSSTETKHNRIPQEKELASTCYVTPCSEDPSCSLGSEAHFEAPPDIPIGANEVGLYFDFAHPLSETFRFEPNSTHASVFHLTGLNKAAVEQGRNDPSRLLRAVGSLPADSQILDILTKKDRQKKLGLHSLWAPRHVHDRKEDERVVHQARQVLHETCSAHGTEIGRKLHAPNIAIALEHIDECQGPHHNIHSTEFESCLMRVGCAHAGPDDGLLPFHGPWFSKLPFDIIAWQQPAPFCCAKPYVVDHRSHEMHREFLQEVGVGDTLANGIDAISDPALRSSLQSSWRHGSKKMRHLLASSRLDKDGLTWVASFTKHVRKALDRFMKELKDSADAEGDDDVEVAEDGTSFLQVHQDGDIVAPSGRRAVEIARWSEDRGSFLQVQVHNSSLVGNVENLVKRVPGAIYEFGFKPLWNHILAPLTRMGINAITWCIEHPQSALFISKLALSLRDRLCEKSSIFVYGRPEAEIVGLFTKVSDQVGKAQEYLSSTFSPAVLLVGLQHMVLDGDFMQKVKGMGRAVFGGILAATGPIGAIIGTMGGMIADAAADAGKQALEFMIYQEIAKEVPSNLFDMITKRCLQPPAALRKVGINATIGEVSGFAKRTVSSITDTIARKGRDLDDSLQKLERLVNSDKAVDKDNSAIGLK
eukprot:TRINITY_DN42875_c0_g1_i1.p1 TRINITY_DN42875_c0_g1~~TRINITY_DN42875_c0_g1_i1.p1  ORF type:complete len:1085 (+),score=144.74 TRINITY_DN42875_c0_g1_i1:72-3257(+)